MSTLLKQDLAPARRLMERVLRDGAAIDGEFPLVFRQGFPGKVVSLGDPEGVRSACTVIARDLVCPGARLRVGLVGSVSTDPEFRSQGLATRVLESAERALAAEGAALALLWADDPRFYFARGYRPAGAEDDYAIGESELELLPRLDGVRPARPEDSGAIHALYREHPSRVERSRGETAALLECPGMTTLVHASGARVTGYACLGRGRDLEGTIHEWGGSPGAVLGLVRAHAERRAGEPTFLMAPTTATELRERMDALGVPCSRGVLGLAKVIDRGAVARLLGGLLGPDARVTHDPSATDAAQVRVRGPRAEELVNDDTLLVMLLSSKGERDDTQAFGEHLGLDLSRLPLEPFLWGLDSI